jgi:hypothetical protein
VSDWSIPSSIKRAMSLQDKIADGNTNWISDRLLENSSSITSLDLSGKQLPGKKIRKIMVSLDNNTVCKTLKLNNNQIEDKYAQYIAETIRRNDSLEKYL